MKNNILLFVFILLGMTTKSYAQDLHFSQFYNAPLQLNPAMTGLMEGDIRIMGNYRSQWGSVTVPFTTFAVAGDASLLKGFATNDFVGAGILLMNDQAGDAEFRITQAQLSIAYFKVLNDAANHYIGLGFQLGGVQHSITEENLFFDNQFNGDIFDTSIPTGENFGRNNFFYTDLSAGFIWYLAPNKYNDVFFGLSMAHVNQPDVTFYESDLKENLYTRYTIHGGAMVRLNGIFSLLPRVILLNQGPHREANVGVLAKLYLDANNTFGGETHLYIGGTYRIGDAVVPTIRLDYSNLSATISYDLNVSKLSTVSLGRGGMELAVSYVFDLFDIELRKDQKVGCPKF